MRQIGIEDIGLVVGLSLAMGGLWIVNPALVVVVVGAGMAALSIFFAKPSRRG